MNLKVKNLSDGISIVTINEPKTYNALSFRNLNDDLTRFGDAREAYIELNKVF